MVPLGPQSYCNERINRFLKLRWRMTRFLSRCDGKFHLNFINWPISVTDRTHVPNKSFLCNLQVKMGPNSVNFTKMFRLYTNQDIWSDQDKSVRVPLGSGVSVVLLKSNCVCLSILSGKYSLDLLSHFKVFLALSYLQNRLFFELFIYHRKENFMKIPKMQIVSLLNNLNLKILYGFNIFLLLLPNFLLSPQRLRF